MADTSSTFSIPGVTTSKYGTDKLIEGLMKVERVPRDKAAARLDTLTKERSSWTDLNASLGTLRNSARDLYSFRNPFSDRVAKSSDETSLTATATREALEQTRKVEVGKVATADRFISDKLAKDYRVAAGTYVFTLGEKKVELSWSGGALKDFAEALGRKGRDLIGASVMAVTQDTRSLVVEGLKTGSANRLGFSADAERLALDLGLVERATTRAQVLGLARPSPWTRPLDPAAIKASDSSLVVQTGGEARLALPSPVVTTGLVLELQYRMTRLPESAAPVAPPGPALPDSGSATFGGITIRGAPSDASLPEWEAPPTAPRVDDSGMAFALAPNGGSVPLANLADSSEPTTLRVELGSLLPDLAGLGLRNRDTSRRLELLSARVYDPGESGGFKPRKPIATAGDALVSVDGVEAVRDSNTVTDMIPGVTLQLKEPSDKPVQLTISPDRKAAKEAIISLVGTYNKLMAWMNILTRADPAIIAQLDYFTEAEKKTATDRLGIYQGDSTLSLLRERLQRSMMDPYRTSLGRDLTLLSQIGVSTDSRKPGSGSGVDASRLLGYIEIDEPTLDKALASSFQAVRELFGYDSNGDLIVDTGVAFALEGSAKPYVETGGIISTKNQTLDSQISGEKRNIATLDEKLVAKQAALKAKFSQMEGALNSMESTSTSIDTFSRNN